MEKRIRRQVPWWLILATALLSQPGCAGRSMQEVSYDMLREREYQLCLQQGRDDCRRYESYEEYQREREESVQGR